MAATAALRRFWLNTHLWLGIGLMVLSVPIAVSGALLVVHDELEELLHPARYAVTGRATLPPSAYINAARGTLPAGLAISAVRFADDGPVIVNARGRGADGTPPQILNVFMDPPTARVLETVDMRASFFGFLHFFHENLTIPQYSGRAIVGWVGVAMLISSLSGIYLWWPRKGGFARGLRYTRSTSTNSNLHHTLGFWISVPLAIVSLTGIYLGFPQQGRDLISSMTPMTPRAGFGAPARQTALTIDEVLAKAVTTEGNARPSAVFAATGQGTPMWRVQLRTASGDNLSVTVDDRSGAVERQEPLKGDRIAQWIRWVHEGSHLGPVWKAIVFFCGALPPLFAVTGVIMWLRRRRVKRGAALAPAE